MIPNEPTPERISPLKDVWLRPRRVFRELAPQPVGTTDYVLAAAQGVATYLALFRAQSSVLRLTGWEIIGSSLRIGPIVGIASAFLFSVIYGRIGTRAGGKSTRQQVFHVLAYGGVPVVASLGLWGLTAALIGEAAFLDTPSGDADSFVTLVSGAQTVLYVLLLLWGVVLQVMGFSEIQGLELRKAFGVWVLGQLFGVLAFTVLVLILSVLFPGILPDAPN
jgi:hypothetical protein